MACVASSLVSFSNKKVCLEGTKNRTSSTFALYFLWDLASVVQRVESNFHWIIPYLWETSMGFGGTYPTDSNLSIAIALSGHS